MRFLPFLASFSLLSAAQAPYNPAGDASQLTEEQIQQVVDRVDRLEKEHDVTTGGRGGVLSIAGDVRFEFQATSEKSNNVRQRGPYGQYPNIPDRNFDVEVNLMLDYRAKRTWASVKIEFDNNAGSSSGTVDALALQRAFLGARLVDASTYNLDLEIGRQQLDYVFDSKIQFGSYFDGMLFRFDKATAKWGDFYIHGGPFVVNELRSHFGLVAEAGLLSIYNTGLYAKYSFINWAMKGYPVQILDYYYGFTNSQLILGYEFTPPRIGKLVNIYLAGLINTKAKGTPQTDGRLANKAWYAGVSIGILKEAGDFALDLNYQYVQPQSIPDFDANGIGRGNTPQSGLYTTRVDGTGTVTSVYNASGNANYKGISINLLYLFTPNITLQQSYQQAINENPNVGPNIRFKQYEMEIIYAF